MTQYNKLLLASVIGIGLGVAHYFLYQYNYNESEDTMSLVVPDVLVYAQPNLTELDFPDLVGIEDMNEINRIKRLGSQATNEVKTFTGLIDNVAGTCAYKMEQDVFNTTLAQMCADLLIDYANTLRNFTESNQNITNSILYEYREY